MVGSIISRDSPLITADSALGIFVRGGKYHLIINESNALHCLLEINGMFKTKLIMGEPHTWAFQLCAILCWLRVRKMDTLIRRYLENDMELEGK